MIPFTGHRHIRELDALRGIAIFGVVMTHVASSLALMGLYPPFLLLDLTQFFVTGGVGVPLFFLLSGFLLTTTERARHATGRGNLVAYARRRFLRLAPAYYLSLLLYLALQLHLDAYHPAINPGLDLLTYISFLHSALPATGSNLNPAYWSLTCEVVFYACLPLLVRLRVGAGIGLALYLLSLLLAAALYYVFATTRDVSLQFAILFHPATNLHLFLAGSLLATLAATHRRPGMARRLAYCGDFALLFALCGITLNAYLVSTTPVAVVISRLGATVLVAVGFSAYAMGSPLLRRVLALPGLAYLGQISFSIYLFHGLVTNTAEQLGWVAGLRRRAGDTPHLALFLCYLAVVLAGSIAIATLTYHWVEVPGMRGARRPQPALSPRPAS